MDEKYKGKRLEEKKKSASDSSRKGMIAAAILCGVLAVILIGYLILCGVASGNGKYFPHTTVSGVDVSGLTDSEAAGLLRERYTQRYGGLSLPVTVDGETVTISGSEAGVTADVDTALERLREQSKEGFFAAGARYLVGLMGRETAVDCPVLVGDPGYVDAKVTEVLSRVDQTLEETSWSLDKDQTTLIIKKGRTGKAVDRSALLARVMEELRAGTGEPIQVTTAMTAPAPLDFDAIARAVDREMVNAALDPETYEILPEQVGLTLDTAMAARELEKAPEGAVLRLPLTVREAEVTAEELGVNLFRDVLGQAESNVSGTADRNANVRLAAEHCNGTILLPGGQFLYNETIKCTAEEGYQMGSAYVGGETVDVVGGGVCQVSSTIYYAVLRANLKVVERHNHRYAVGYVPDGMDATVYNDSLNFIFENDTPYPIKIESVYENRTMKVKIYGTKLDDTYVETENKRLETIPYSTIYVADPSVPLGETVVKQTPYTGRVVEAYRCLYNGDGTLISRTLESVNKYKSRDQIILYNPEDGDPSAPAETPGELPTEGPTESAPPVPETPTPPTEAPSTEAPPTAEPPVTNEPVETPSAPPSEAPQEPGEGEPGTAPVLPAVPTPVPTPQPPVPEGGEQPPAPPADGPQE